MLKNNLPGGGDMAGPALLPSGCASHERHTPATTMRCVRGSRQIRDGGPAPAGHASEKNYLNKIAETSGYALPMSDQSMAYAASIFSRYWKGDRCLELGPAEGQMTRHLLESFEEIVAVDGSAQICNGLAQRYPTISVVHALFEEYEPAGLFDTVILGHVLEHVLDPGCILRRVGRWLAPGGVVCASVPNAYSLHRQLGVALGILDTVFDLNEADRMIGHRRVYSWKEFREDFEKSNLRILAEGGYFLKIHSNSQMESAAALYSDAFIDGIMQLGERYPDISAEIYIIAALGLPSEDATAVPR